jgi:hypothetical protein
MTDNPELRETARTLASLALEKNRQGGSLRVRQSEQLRRALVTAAATLGWDLMPDSREDRVAAATRDVAELADAGAQLLESDLADQLTGKKDELLQIKRVAESVHELAADSTVSYPTEVEYSHTSRNGLGHLVTKVATLTLNDAMEAQNAAETLERRLVGFEKLRDQMVGELKERQRQVSVMRRGLPGFVESSSGLVVELLALSI